MGAGVGGLSTAHKLARMGHKVHVLERNSEVGGVARSKYLKNGQHSEYCWHVAMKGYTSLLPILQEIPFKGASVADQLKPISQFCYGRDGDHFSIERGGTCFLGTHSFLALYMQGRKLGYYFSFRDMWTLALMHLFIEGSHPTRFESYDNVRWSDLLGPASAGAKKLTINSVGCFLGMEPDRVSAHTMLHVLRKSEVAQSFVGKYRRKDGKIPLCFSLNGPTNEHWMEPWVHWLSDCGVKISLNTNVEEIRCEEGKVKEIVISKDGVSQNLEYDMYVNSMDVQSFGNVLCNMNSLRDNMLELNRRSYQIQPQIVFHLREKVHFGEPTIMMLFDTPWALMYRPEGPLWDIPLGKEPTAPGELLSVGIGVWHRKGLLYNKTARECTEQEIASEVWEQLKSSRGHLRHFKTDTGKTMDDIAYDSYNIWPSFSYSTQRGGLDTWEPKFSNNVGTVALRPRTMESSLFNLVHANAYTRTDSNLYNMNSAAEAGVRAANYIMGKEAKADYEKYPTPNRFWSFCHKMDHKLLSRGLANLPETLLRL